MSDKVNLRIALLGKENNKYTRIMIVELNRRNISYDLILVKPAKEPYQHTFLGRKIIFLSEFFRFIYSGRFKQLSKFSLFFWRSLFAYFKSKRSKQYREMMNPYLAPSFEEMIKAKTVLYTPGINHVKVYEYLNSQKYDIGVFGGVDIVSGPIISAFQRFCLNAHPAPLPQCRGGGALENTLNYGLAPAASVHIATEEIDAGEILGNYPIPVYENDTFELVSARAPIICAGAMADVLAKISMGEELPALPNTGKLHYWKDCTPEIQKKARQKLKLLIQKKKDNKASIA